ncbi:LOW QUALITY PROTEIN: F-box/WD repeat-containing protein 10-like [Chlamydotis macqueenii]
MSCSHLGPSLPLLPTARERARCWNIYSGACLKVFNGYCGTITCLDLPRDGLLLATRRLWNISKFYIQPLQYSGITSYNGKSERGPSLSVLAHPDMAEITSQHEKRIVSRCPMSPNKFLLTVSMLQSTCKSALLSTSIKHSEKSGKHGNLCGNISNTAPKRYRRTKPLCNTKRMRLCVRSHGDSLPVKRIYTPFETKMLQLKLKNSSHGPTVNPSIPAPSVERPKTCWGLVREKKAQRGHGKAISLGQEGVQLINPFTASSELIKSMHVMIAQIKKEAVSRSKKPFCPYAADPSQSSSGFRLLPGKQKEVYEAVARCQAHHTEPRDQQRPQKKAWLRKTKSLPLDCFIEEGKADAPELGLSMFIWCNPFVQQTTSI